MSLLDTNITSQLTPDIPTILESRGFKLVENAWIIFIGILSDDSLRLCTVTGKIEIRINNSWDNSDSEYTAYIYSSNNYPQRGPYDFYLEGSLPFRDQNELNEVLDLFIRNSRYNLIPYNSVIPGSI